MPQKDKSIAEGLLHGKGYEKCPDGVWRKKNSTHQNPSGGTNSKPSQRQQKRRAGTPSQSDPASRLVAIVTVRTVRPRDYDGLGASSKHYLDALIQECGLCKDDSPDNFEVLAVPERVCSFSEEETIIEIFRVSLQDDA